MKRFIAAFVAVAVLLSTGLGAAAADAEFLSGLYTNYTGEYSVSVTFEGGEDIAALLEEVGIADELSVFADIKALLTSLLSQKTEMLLRGNISEDFSKAQVSLTAVNEQLISVNPNLSIDIRAKTGMWVDMDLGGDEPKMQVIYSTPFMNKYAVIDAFNVMDEEERAVVSELFKSILNREMLEELQKNYAEIFKKHAFIDASATKCTMKITNDGLCAMVDELMSLMVGAAAGMIGEDIPQDFEIPSIMGVGILGERGITYTCALSGGKPSSISMDADMAIDISTLFEVLTGAEWMYEAKGLLAFDISVDVKLSKYGKTQVEFPKLTAENSLDLASELVPKEDIEAGNEAEETYPAFYVWVVTDMVYSINGELFVPLRATVEEAYEDACEIAYSNGRITLTSEHFNGFSQLVFNVGSDKAYADKTEHTVDKVFVVDGVSYVSVSTFEDIFGWELESAVYDMLHEEYSYGFYTETYN